MKSLSHFLSNMIRITRIDILLNALFSSLFWQVLTMMYAFRFGTGHFLVRRVLSQCS